MFIWTETPLTEIWQQLRYFKSSTNVASVLSGKIKNSRKVLYPPGTDLVQKSVEIATCIRQADEYYQAAESVSLVTRPLLHFYGAECLAKALVLANMEAKFLVDIKYHGLTTRASSASDSIISKELQGYSDTPGCWEIEKEFGVVNDGLFPLLCTSIGMDHPPAKGSVFYLKEVFSLLPDLSEMYLRHYQEAGSCFLLEGMPSQTNDNKTVIAFGVNVSLADLKKIFPVFDSDYDLIQKGRLTFQSKNSNTYLPGLEGHGIVAGNYLVAPHGSGLSHPLCVAFVGLFILSNTVRYKPSFWMKVIEGSESGSISMVEAFNNLTKRLLTNAILEHLWREKFTYATPGYFS